MYLYLDLTCNNNKFMVVKKKSAVDYIGSIRQDGAYIYLYEVDQDVASGCTNSVCDKLGTLYGGLDFESMKYRPTCPKIIQMSISCVSSIRRFYFVFMLGNSKTNILIHLSLLILMR